MSSPTPAFCPICNEDMDLDEDLEHHLVYRHRPQEVAAQLVAEWEADELGDAA